MQAQYVIDLPFPVSVNQLYRVARGRPIMSPAYRAWIAEADAMAMVQRTGVLKPLSNFNAEIFLRAADRGRRDLDNFAKGVLDWAQRVNLIANDRACDRLTMSWTEDLAPEGCRLVLVGEWE